MDPQRLQQACDREPAVVGIAKPRSENWLREGPIWRSWRVTSGAFRRRRRELAAEPKRRHRPLAADVTSSSRGPHGPADAHSHWRSAHLVNSGSATSGLGPRDRPVETVQSTMICCRTFTEYVERGAVPSAVIRHEDGGPGVVSSHQGVGNALIAGNLRRRSECRLCTSNAGSPIGPSGTG